MLKLRTIGMRGYRVLEGRQRIGRIRLATERMPCVWLWSVTIHLTGGLPMARRRTSTRPRRSSRRSGNRPRTTPEQFAAAYKAMNIRDAD